MIENPNVIPLTVAAAVAIFLLRELVDTTRRYRSNARKLHALRALLAAECERNNFAIGRLREQADEIRYALEQELEIILQDARTGRDRLVIMNGRDLHVSSPIPKLHSSTLDQYLFEAASLDRELFRLMEHATVCLAEVAHIREGIITYTTDETEHLESFPDYAIRELDEALEGVRSLYLYCQGEPLTATRVR